MPPPPPLPSPPLSSSSFSTAAAAETAAAVISSHGTDMSFRTYCESTSLHGWQYIYKGKSEWRAFWSGMVLSSVIVACCFVFKQASEFTKATVVTTVDTTTAPLSDVFFPSVTICNINQVRRSFLEELGVRDNFTVVDMIFREFYTGSDADLDRDQRDLLEQLFSTQYYVQKEIEYSYMSTKGYVNSTVLANWKDYLAKYRKYIVSGTHFTNFAVQEPGGVMILSASFEGRTKPGSSADFNPYFGTDVGICSIVKPQLNFNESLDNLPFWTKLFQANSHVKPGCQVGKANGLSVLLDAETFDYMYHLKAGEGFKLSVHHHLDQPIMSIKEIDISVGTESQVAVATTLTTTTDEARHRFEPMQRGCYFEGELALKYLPREFYRYEMSNCLFEGAYEEVLSQCNCTPSFHQTGIREYPRICTGKKLQCMTKILHRIGNYNSVVSNDKEKKETTTNRHPCLAACEDQVTLVTETSSSFPNSETFHRRGEFCLIVRKLLKTCGSKKAAALTDHFPSICSQLSSLQQKDKEDLICSKGYWDPAADHPHLLEILPPPSSSTLNDLIRQDLFAYAKRNMALVNVYIKEPVVTRIMRDQKIPLIGFVANTGGLLGLCMGFSLVSAFEIVYHCLICVYEQCTQGARRMGVLRGGGGGRGGEGNPPDLSAAQPPMKLAATELVVSTSATKYWNGASTTGRLASRPGHDKNAAAAVSCKRRRRWNQLLNHRADGELDQRRQSPSMCQSCASAAAAADHHNGAKDILNVVCVEEIPLTTTEVIRTDDDLHSSSLSNARPCWRETISDFVNDSGGDDDGKGGESWNGLVVGRTAEDDAVGSSKICSLCNVEHQV